LAGPFTFTKGLRLLKTPASGYQRAHQFGTLLFDLQADPRQERPLKNAAVEARMIEHLIRLMKFNDAPAEQFQRLGLSP
jgi:hypothetical protein